MASDILGGSPTSVAKSSESLGKPLLSSELMFLEVGKSKIKVWANSVADGISVPGLQMVTLGSIPGGEDPLK